MNRAEGDSWEFSGRCDEPGRIKGHCQGHRITIEAPPELVWDFVADITGWGSWNPLYSSTHGVAEEGEVLRLRVHLAGARPRKASGVVTAVRQNELLEYQITRLGGVLKSLRYVEIEEISPTRCRVVNAVVTGGLLGSLVTRTLGEKVARGTKEMNLALKAVAERKWRGRPT